VCARLSTGGGFSPAARKRHLLVSEDVHPVAPALLEQVAANAAGMDPGDRLGAQVLRLRTREQSAVFEYRFAGGLRLIAKRYSQRGQALAAYDVLGVLRAQGFGSELPYRVAEPLGCFADWGVLVTCAVPGQQLRTLAGQPAPWEEGLRAAARWLARLHTLSVEIGPEEDIPEGLLRVARNAARAGAHHPELEPVLAPLIEELAERAGSVAGSRSHAPTHGRYHAGHVFVAPDSVAVVDLDRVALADPAKDVGEFIHRLRAQTQRARLGADAAERATLAFVDEYALHAHAVPARLAYYWSQSILATLLRVVEVGRAKWEKRLEFYRAEFEGVPRRASALSELVE
jgi:aminoglycoside phosphotransferase